MRLKDLVKLLPPGEEVCIYDWYFDYPRAIVFTYSEVRLETPWGTEKVPVEEIEEALRKWGFEKREKEIYLSTLFRILENKQVFHRLYDAEVSFDKDTSTRGLISDGVVCSDSFLIELALRILRNKSTLAEFY